jgi:hypothetical protein
VNRHEVRMTFSLITIQSPENISDFAVIIKFVPRADAIILKGWSSASLSCGEWTSGQVKSLARRKTRRRGGCATRPARGNEPAFVGERHQYCFH